MNHTELLNTKEPEILTNRTTKAERATHRNKGAEDHNRSDTTLVDVVSVLVQ